MVGNKRPAQLSNSDTSLPRYSPTLGDFYMTIKHLLKWFILGEMTKRWQHIVMSSAWLSMFALALFNPFGRYHESRIWWMVFSAWAFGVQGTKFLDWDKQTKPQS